MEQTSVEWLEQRLIESGVNLLSGEVKFIQQAKQMEKEQRMYSEEDLLSAFEAGMMFIGEDKGSFKEWFKQFKK